MDSNVVKRKETEGRTGIRKKVLCRSMLSCKFIFSFGRSRLQEA